MKNIKILVLIIVLFSINTFASIKYVMIVPDEIYNVSYNPKLFMFNEFQRISIKKIRLSETTDEIIKNNNIILLGGIDENSFTERFLKNKSVKYYSKYPEIQVNNEKISGYTGIIYKDKNPFNKEKNFYVFDKNIFLVIHGSRSYRYKNFNEYVKIQGKNNCNLIVLDYIGIAFAGYYEDNKFILKDYRKELIEKYGLKTFSGNHLEIITYKNNKNFNDEDFDEEEKDLIEVLSKANLLNKLPEDFKFRFYLLLTKNLLNQSQNDIIQKLKSNSPYIEDYFIHEYKYSGTAYWDLWFARGDGESITYELSRLITQRYINDGFGKRKHLLLWNGISNYLTCSNKFMNETALHMYTDEKLWKKFNFKDVLRNKNFILRESPYAYTYTGFLIDYFIKISKEKNFSVIQKMLTMYNKNRNMEQTVEKCLGYDSEKLENMLNVYLKNLLNQNKYKIYKNLEEYYLNMGYIVKIRRN